MQTHATECGAACLGSVLAYFGRWIPLSEIRNRCKVSRDGSTAGGISRAARHYGLECKGRSVDLDHLRRLPLPLIVFWEFNHFLILEGYDRHRYYLNDPAAGRRKVSASEFGSSFTGIVLEFKTDEEFRKGGKSLGILDRVLPWFHESWSALAALLLCGFLVTLLALVSPLLLTIFIDHVLGDKERWGLTVFGFMIGAGILIYGLTILKQQWLKRLSVRMSVMLGNHCVSHLLRLPVEYFTNRLAGELITRLIAIENITRSVSRQFVPLLIDLVMCVVLLAVMLSYDLLMATIVLVLSILYATLARSFNRLRMDESHALRREQGLLSGIGTLMVSHTDALRATAADDRFFSRWGGHQARELAARQRFSEFSHVYAALPGFFLGLGGAAVIGMGALQVMAGEFTLGQLVGFYLVASLFLEPIGRFVELIDGRHALQTDMQRLEDITNTETDPRLTKRDSSVDTIATLDGRLRLAGHVELRNVTFGYNKDRTPLIRDFSLTIEPGQRVAIVGPSGSGKSTLSQLVAGSYQPWSGEIVFDGRPPNEIPEEVMSRSLSMVDQNIALFAASVRDNITLWNPAVPDSTVVSAARDACIHDDILNHPLGYATFVEEGGGNFSGGQKQRLEIARALASKPSILILDEATSALDADTEAMVEDAFRRRGCTCLVVAHRLSAVRDCDEIIVLERGSEVQRGTHDELMADSDGLYYRLVRAG